MTTHFKEKKYLSAKGLLEKVRSCFDNIEEPPRDSRGLKNKIPLTDCLMSGLAIFGLKFPSLLQFDQAAEGEVIKHNLKTLYGIDRVPSDTYMRERLDFIDPDSLRAAFSDVFFCLQRGKVLEDYKFLDQYLLIPCDGTGLFSSKEIYCNNCCQKHHKDGSISYYHQMLAGVIVHPDYKEVLPFCPEPISKPDGSSKNDCEQNAFKRFLDYFYREHPRLKPIFTYDALIATAPPLRFIKEKSGHFIVGVKPEGNASLFEWLKGVDLATHHVKTKKETLEFRFFNKIPLNDSNHDFEVNFFECTIRDAKGKKTGFFSWITDILITKENITELSRGARARWKIENETFNTLKNQGYNFEHNYGHGNKHLCHVFGTLMFLAFLIDQIQQRCCGLFQAALKKMKTKTRLWKRFYSVFTELLVPTWEDFFLWMIDNSGKVLLPNSS